MEAAIGFSITYIVRNSIQVLHAAIESHSVRADSFIRNASVVEICSNYGVIRRIELERCVSISCK